MSYGYTLRLRIYEVEICESEDQQHISSEDFHLASAYSVIRSSLEMKGFSEAISEPSPSQWKAPTHRFSAPPTFLLSHSH